MGNNNLFTSQWPNTPSAPLLPHAALDSLHLPPEPPKLPSRSAGTPEPLSPPPPPEPPSHKTPPSPPPSSTPLVKDISSLPAQPPPPEPPPSPSLPPLSPPPST